MNWRLILCLVFCLAFWTTVYRVAVAAPVIPQQAQKHRALLTREARAQWGMDAPIATFAAQIHQESTWREDAVSPVGAQGLAQFMPSTATWMPQVAPETGEPMPFSPSWAIRAMVTYNRWLFRRIGAWTDCDRWAFTLSAYNGGLGWVQRDKALTLAKRMDPNKWSHVALHNAGRSAANFKENRGYPIRILGPLTNLYRVAGWGKGACDD